MLPLLAQQGNLIPGSRRRTLGPLCVDRLKHVVERTFVTFDTSFAQVTRLAPGSVRRQWRRLGACCHS